MSPSTIHITRSESETVALAQTVAARVQSGDVLLLSGNLGAGKTAFVRGLALGLGVPGDEVTSPTFTLIHEYRGGRLPLFHADLYRLEPSAAEELGLEQLDGVLAVEWPERLGYQLRGAREIRIEWVDDTTRRITIS